MIFLLCLAFPVRAQETFRAMFYNVENLFDTVDDPHKNDNEFLPGAQRRWTPVRYREKLNRIARVIVHNDSLHLPALVGLCEVENDSCLHALTRHSLLRGAGYRHVITDSPDQRGIDVALLYRPSAFRVVHQDIIRIPHKRLKRGPTRDILYVSGVVSSGDTLDVLVVHKPSRSGGEKKSAPYREITSRMLAQRVDSLHRVRLRPSVLVMGDFNDYPSDPSVAMLSASGLHNLMAGKLPGTYRYRGEWGILDHILVSSSMLLPQSGIHTTAARAHILSAPFLLEEDERYGGTKPFRTYNGMTYRGGYSDHLPVYVDLLIRGDRDCCSE